MSKVNIIQLSEFDDLKNWWNNRESSDVAWCEDIEKIKANGYNLDIKNPYQPEEVKKHTSRELLDLLHASFSKGDELLDQLSKELG